MVHLEAGGCVESCSKTFLAGNTHTDRQKNPTSGGMIGVNSIKAGEGDGREVPLEQGCVSASRQDEENPAPMV